MSRQSHPVLERLEEAMKQWLPPPAEYKQPKPNGATPPMCPKRMRAYAQAALEGERRKLAAMSAGGRNDELYLAACRLGKYVHHVVLSLDEVEAALLEASSSNGLIREEGPKACEATLASGLRKAEGDELPHLEDRNEGDAEQKPRRQRASTDRSSQATALADIACGEDAELFRTPDGVSYADLRINGHRETWPVRSRAFKWWLRGTFYERTGSAPNSEAMSAALDLVEARAQFGGIVRSVYLRVAEHEGRIYVNLCDLEWRAVEIETGGWCVVDEPPVRFSRRFGMLALPGPVRGGSMAELKEHLRMSSSSYTLTVAWLLAALRPRGPYPVLTFTGEQGTAKSTTLRMLRHLVDPNTAPLRAPPDATRDLYVAAINGHVITLDNVTSLPADVSDALCRLSTGGGFSTRSLYTNDEELLFDGQRPVGMTSIADAAVRPDLLDRTLGVRLEVIPDSERKLEDELWAAFDVARPRILGALYDAIAYGLKHLNDTRPNRLPRMADFARWSVACETAYQKPGTFMDAYDEYREEAIDIVLDGDLVADALRRLMKACPRGKEGHPEIVTTSKDLLESLTGQVSEQQSRSRLWPKTPEGLAGRLTKLAPALRKAGIVMERLPREGKRRPIVIRDTGPKE